MARGDHVIQVIGEERADVRGDDLICFLRPLL